MVEAEQVHLLAWLQQPHRVAVVAVAGQIMEAMVHQAAVVVTHLAETLQEVLRHKVLLAVLQLVVVANHM
jgi:hypothetical protein